VRRGAAQVKGRGSVRVLAIGALPPSFAEGYVNGRLVYPPGFVSTRMYASAEEKVPSRPPNRPIHQRLSAPPR